MYKIKIIFLSLFFLFFALVALVSLKLKHKEELHQKTILAQETRKALEHLMLDLSEARIDTILDLPADGLWHKRVAFDRARQKGLEYLVTNGHLLRIDNGKTILIADDIGGLRIRRQKMTPNILEVQIQAQNDFSLTSNFKIRVEH